MLVTPSPPAHSLFIVDFSNLFSNGILSMPVRYRPSQSMYFYMNSLIVFSMWIQFVSPLYAPTSESLRTFHFTILICDFLRSGVHTSGDPAELFPFD